MRLIDADDFGNRMYHEAFEKDSDLQKWDSGCWIRYKLFENVLREQPTIQPVATDINVGDIISRQQAIDALKNRWKKTRNYEGIGDDIAEECELYLKQVPSAQPEQRWIPCSKRLPKKIEKDYWICTDEGWQCVCRWRKFPSMRGDFWAWNVMHPVVAWMPRPEPYKGGEQNG